MRLALTGGIASGKSFVAGELARLGAVIIDADVLSREVVAPGTVGLQEIVQQFGSGILTKHGGLDRSALAQVIFADSAARADLEAIIHPRVRALANQVEAQAPQGAVVVHVIPLLVEAGLVEDFEHILVVDVPSEVQLARLQQRDGFSAHDAAQRISSQASREERLAVADWVIDNSAGRDSTVDQVERWWHDVAAKLAGR